MIQVPKLACLLHMACGMKEKQDPSRILPCSTINSLTNSHIRFVWKTTGYPSSVKKVKLYKTLYDINYYCRAGSKMTSLIILFYYDNFLLQWIIKLTDLKVILFLVTTSCTEEHSAVQGRFVSVHLHSPLTFTAYQFTACL